MGCGTRGHQRGHSADVTSDGRGLDAKEQKSKVMETRELISNIEEDASLPLGSSERFAGYAVIGLPFRSGHVLALRRFISATSTLGE
jgi:hypothetical protein